MNIPSEPHDPSLTSGPQGVQGVEGAAGVQGIQGVQGERGKPGPMAGPLAVAAAEAMTEAVRDNTKALKRVKRSLFWSWLVTGLVVVALIVGSVAFVLQRKVHLEDCARDNDLRQANIDLWTPFLVRPILKPGPDATMEEIAEYEQQIKDRDDFTLRINKSFATHSCEGYLF